MFPRLYDCRDYTMCMCEWIVYVGCVMRVEEVEEGGGDVKWREVAVEGEVVIV